MAVLPIVVRTQDDAPIVVRTPPVRQHSG
jgi:hypothetical protein